MSAVSLSYQTPSLVDWAQYEQEMFAENEVIPVIIVAAAKIVGISVGFAAWICSVACPGQCRSLWGTVSTLGRWLTTGC